MSQSSRKEGFDVSYTVAAEHTLTTVHVHCSLKVEYNKH